MMRFTYDKDADAAYIIFEHPLADGAVKKSVEIGENIIIDYDGKGKLVGIEILDASSVINES